MLIIVVTPHIRGIHPDAPWLNLTVLPINKPPYRIQPMNPKNSHNVRSSRTPTRHNFDSLSNSRFHKSSILQLVRPKFN